MKKQTISDDAIRIGDIFFVHTRFNLLVPIQMLIGKVNYSRFVHAGIVVDPENKKLIHVAGGGSHAIMSDSLISAIFSFQDYRIFRPRDPRFAHKIAETANEMFNISDENKSVQYGISLRKILFKNRPSALMRDREELLNRYTMSYMSKHSDATLYCTEFVAFCIQVAAHQLGWDYRNVLDIEHTALVPSLLVNKLKHDKLHFEEFKSVI